MRSTALALRGLILLCACESGPDSIKIKGPRDALDMGKEASLFPVYERKGDTVQLRVSAFDKKGRFQGAVPVKWDSSDRTVATVSQEGVVTFLSSGDVKVTATTQDEKKLTAAVPLKAVIVKDIRIIEPKVEKGAMLEIPMGETMQFKAEVLDDRGNVIEDAKIKWNSTSYAATVTITGEMEGRSMGKTQIEAEASNGATARVNVDVGDWKKKKRRRRR